jgi:aminopeptidase N
MKVIFSGLSFWLIFLISFYRPLFAQEQIIQKQELEARSSLFQRQENQSGKNIDVLYYRCQWRIDPQIRFIKGKVRTTFKALDTASFLVFDFYNGLTVDSVKFRGQKVASQFTGSQLFRISLGQTINLGTIDSISIYYNGIPANSGFGAFNRQLHAGVPIIWTMSCPYAARDWWPCKQDLRDKPDSIELIISTPHGNRAAGNGSLVAEYSLGNDRVFHWKHKYPIASYLIATAVTNYVAYSHKVKLPSQAAGDSLPVLNFVYPESQTSARANTPKILPILQFYDSLVGPYPFAKEKYGHAQFGWGGGMEHQTMSFMTNFSFDLQAHELAHQWFGNHITCRSWRDIWLNEGWATYMAAFCGSRFGTSNFVNWLNGTINQITANPSGSVWVNDTSNINRVFDYRLTYQKGALLVHMLRWEIGDSAFWAGVRNYQADPALTFGFSSTAQFIQHLEATSGRSLQFFVDQWFTGQGHPIIQVLLTKNGTDMQLRLSQTTSHASVAFFKLKIPIRFRATGFDTTLIFNPINPIENFEFSLPFSPTSVNFDPQKWILARSNTQIITQTLEAKGNRILFSVFPNPFSNQLVLKNESAENQNFKIFDAKGQVWKTGSITPHFQNSLEVENWQPGFYWLQVGEGVDQQIYKLLKY